MKTEPLDTSPGTGLGTSEVRSMHWGTGKSGRRHAVDTRASMEYDEGMFNTLSMISETLGFLP